MITVALAGDAMLGRQVGDAIARSDPRSLVDAAVVEAAAEADLFVLNLECCISERGERWPDPWKPFFFRAPVAAVELLTHLRVDCVTLANNHALDFGAEALLDTFEHLRAAGIALVGAGADEDAARAPVVLAAGASRLAVVAFADHPHDFAAGPGRPGIAFAELEPQLSGWVAAAVGGVDADAVLVSPHWGANMTTEPTPAIRAAAESLVEAGATLVAGHSAHVFHGVADRVLFDLGDFLDDYIVDPVLRNDLGVLVLATLDEDGPIRLEAIPLELDFCHTRLARGEKAAWVRRRFRDACAALGTEASEEEGRVVVSWDR